MNKDILFNRTAGFIAKVYDFEAKLSEGKGDSEITHLQLELLKILYFSCCKSISGLSECLNINLPNCSREVKKLSLSGFIQKTVSSSDKRKTELSLTDKGKNKVEKFLFDMRDNFFKHENIWSEDKIKKCIDSIDILEKELFK